MGLFDKIKKAFTTNKTEAVEKYDKGLEKTRKEFVSQLSNLSKKYKNIDENYFEELEDILIMADIGVDTVMKFVELLRKRVKTEKIEDASKLKDIIIDELFIMYVGNDILDSKIHYAEDGPTVILFVGVNGVGKTTTIGKFAHQLKEQGKKVMLVAGDTFRAGAIEQLEEWGEKVGTTVISSTSKDPSSVMYDGLEKAVKEDYDVVLIDTAGRLQNKENLMRELEKVNRVIQKIIPKKSNIIGIPNVFEVRILSIFLSLFFELRVKDVTFFLTKYIMGKIWTLKKQKQDLALTN